MLHIYIYDISHLRVKERADDNRRQKSGSVPKRRGMSQTVLNDTPKQYVQNGIKAKDNSPLGASASSIQALDEASNNQNNGVLYFRTVLDSTESRLKGMCHEWLHFQSSVHDLPPEANELISVAVGQTQLLLSIKLILFHDLINKREKSLAGETEKKNLSPFQICKDFWTWY